MRYVEGGSLRERLHEGPLPIQLAAKLLEQIARAAHYAHERGIIHRDLKPGNILMTTDGTPLVSDFGLAKVLDEGRMDVTSPGVVIGTPAYMAQEQAAGDVPRIGSATDVYTLGLVLYEALTGRWAFSSASMSEMLVQVRQGEFPPPRQYRRDLPRDLEAICLKCLEREPENRY